MSVEFMDILGQDDSPASGDLNSQVNNQVDGQANQGDYEMDPDPGQTEKKKAPAKKAATKKAPPKKEAEGKTTDISCKDDKCDSHMMGECAAGFVFDGDECKAYKAGPGFGK